MTTIESRPAEMCGTERDLLRAVLVDPFDDLPRLVYADWLDEHGDGERAEFIRVQIELAKLPHPYTRLRDREYELWRSNIDYETHKQHCHLIPGSVATTIDQTWKPAGHAIFLVSRGFVSGVSCRLVDFMAGLAAVVAARWPILSVTITDAVIHESMGASYFYVGGLGAFPQKYWERLDRLPSRLACKNALSEVCVDHARELAGLPKLNWGVK